MATAPATPGDSFALAAPFPHLHRAASAAARSFLSWIVRRTEFGRLYARSHEAPGETFEARALATLGIGSCVRTVPGRELRIPTSGPLIVAANHPTGAADGLVLLEAVRQIRPDVRILANHLLSYIPELERTCIFVDPFGGRRAAERSHAGLRAAHRWLQRGGALIVFPAGEVAHASGDAGQTTAPADSPWSSTVGRLALATCADVLPVFIDARNSRLFYAAGRLHRLFRTALLWRELLNKQGTTVAVHLGVPIAAAHLRRSDNGGVTAAIRCAVDSLARAIPVAAAVDPEMLDAEVRALPADAKLLSSGSFDVFCADAREIPAALREIGRLRELTFRAAGEGTGQAIDLDRFDGHYRHLFVWNRDRQEIAGAYRIGETDRIAARHGADGLYTRTLFRYDQRLLERVGPALELGRSFVRIEYQRRSHTLLLLWKGIGRMVANAPRYRRLFGPVSISARYDGVSRQLLRAFLTSAHADTALAALVEPRTPPPPLPKAAGAGISDLAELDGAIRALEAGTGVPVLLRHYLGLNARVLGFNVDPSFSHTLDALMVVDLTQVPESTLRRYLGAREAVAFAAHHRDPAVAA